MKKLFISQPMRGLTEEQILTLREELRVRAEKIIGEPVELIDSFFKEYPGETTKSVPIWYLGKSIQLLSEADIVHFGPGWKDAKGCKIEFEVAVKYGLEIIDDYRMVI